MYEYILCFDMLDLDRSIDLIDLDNMFIFLEYASVESRCYREIILIETDL